MKKKTKRLLAGMLTGTMVLGTVNTTAFAASGYLDPDASIEREKDNAEISQYAATQGMVLLENKNQALPIAKAAGTKVALYGNGVYNTIKGGTGSGNVNVRETANVLVKQGFEDAGYDIVNTHKFNGEGTSFLDDRIAEYKEELKKYEGQLNFNYVHSEPVYAETEKGKADIEAAAKETDTAIYVLARTSGEGSDRNIGKGDYYLTDAEKANLAFIGEKFEKVIVVLNIGGVVDTNFFNGLGGYESGDELNRDKIEGLDALFLMSQTGMNEGHALVQVLNGTYNPSGKLTDSWAINYADYPASAIISKNDENSKEEFYEEDIFVGYRYFDTFGKEVAYPFGYGMSYTDFEITTDSVDADADAVTVNATVKNVGSVTGKEVVEVYFSAPTGEIEKPYQELVAYKKVEVEPGKSEKVQITFDTAEMASYNEEKEAYVMEAGDYFIRVGNSSRNNVVAAKIALDQKVITEYCKNELGLTKKTMEDGSYSPIYIMETESIAVDLLDSKSEGFGKEVNVTADGMSANKVDLTLAADSFPSAATHEYNEGNITSYVSSNEADADSYAYGENFKNKEGEKIEKVKTSKKDTLVDVVNGKITPEQLVAGMSVAELADLIEGGTYKEGTASGDNAPIIGNNADSVFGAAGETTSNLYNSKLIPNIVLSDGPAGIRITNKYLSCLPLEENAKYVPGTVYYKFHPYQMSTNPAYYYDAEIKSEEDFNAVIESGEELFLEEGYRYQYCTAFPVGTALAQTWDPEVIEMVGRAIGREMLELGVTSLLAPGMNIHRDPICGRNYEYYSEDPLVSGLTAAAVTNGVQKNEDGTATGIGVTIKHFAFNNQEADRFGSNSVLSERAAREIYLKGFEISVKESHPMFIMSSYNQVNGIPTLQHYGLLTEILRNEWGFDGFVMTDWYAVSGVKPGSQYYGKNVRAVMLYAGNDCEMPGKNEKEVLKGYESGELRLGDLQRSAIHMMNVIKRTQVFDIMYEKILKSDASIAADAALQAKKEAEIAKAEAEAAKAAAEAAQKEAEKKAAEAEKAKADAKKDAEEVQQKLELAKAAQAAAEAAQKAAEKAAADAQAALEKAAALSVTTKLTVNKKSVKVKVGKKVTIKAKVNTAHKITFKSANKKVATVTAKGVVKGKKKGSTSIKVSANGVTKTVKVKVVK